MTKLSIGFHGSRPTRSFRANGPVARTPEETSYVRPNNAPGGAMPRPPGVQGAVGYERNGSSTRRRVIEAGARVFADLGFHAATKEKIGTAAGFSHQTVRDYFRTKEGLLSAIVADAWKSILHAMTAQPGAEALAQIISGYDALDALAHTRPAEARCVLHEAQIAGANGGPLLVEEEREFKRALEQIISAKTGLRGSVVATRAEVIIAAMQALTRPTVIPDESATRYSGDEARQSFRTLAESMLHAAS